MLFTARFAVLKHFLNTGRLDSGACDTDEAKLKQAKHPEKKVEQKPETRYYFDTVTEDCYPFAFMSQPCSKNSNNFATIEKCRSYCKLS
jgi:hypothetical protein